MIRRTGRRPGESGTREAILTAARESFARHGYDGTTMRGIARDAGVDAALVHHYFGTKEELFAAVMTFPIDPHDVVRTVLEPGLDGAGERLVRYLLGVWESPVTRTPLVAVVRAAIRHEAAASVLRGFLGRELVARVAHEIDRPDAELRAVLVGSQLAGLAILRYVIRVEPLASADLETVIAMVAPNVQRYLTGDLPGYGWTGTIQRA